MDHTTGYNNVLILLQLDRVLVASAYNGQPQTVFVPVLILLQLDRVLVASAYLGIIIRRAMLS